MMEAFGDMVYRNVLIWIDDVLLFAKYFDEYLEVIRDGFSRLSLFNIKLNPLITDLVAKDISWCGRKISEKGVSYDESRISGLANLPVPENAAQ